MIKFLLVLLLFVSIVTKAQNMNNIDELILTGKYREAETILNNMIIKDSLNAELHYKKGILLKENNKSAEARQCFTKACKIQPYNLIYLFTLADFDNQNNKYKSAEQLYLKILTIDSVNYKAKLNLAIIYQNTKQYDKAINLFTQIYNTDTSNVFILNKLALTYMVAGKPKISTELYEKSLRINSDYIPTYKALGIINYKRNKMDTAIYYYSEAIKRDSTDADLYEKRGDCYFAQNYGFRSLKDYLRIITDKDSSAILLQKTGVSYNYASNPVKAEWFLLKSYERDSSDIKTNIHLAQLYTQLKQYQKSDYYANRALKMQFEEASYISLIYGTIARNYEAQGNLAKAGEYTEKNYLYAPDELTKRSLIYYLATFYDERYPNRQKAIYYYEKYIEIIPDTPENQIYIETIKKRANYLKKQK